MFSYYITWRSPSLIQCILDYVKVKYSPLSSVIYRWYALVSVFSTRVMLICCTIFHELTHNTSGTAVLIAHSLCGNTTHPPIPPQQSIGCFCLQISHYNYWIIKFLAGRHKTLLAWYILRSNFSNFVLLSELLEYYRIYLVTYQHGKFHYNTLQFFKRKA